MARTMTTNQKRMATEFRKQGFSRRDANIYAQNTSDFMFQTGVMYVSGVMTAATVGAARMAGHAIGWGVGKTVHGISCAIEAHKEKKATQPDKADTKAAKQEERKAKAAAKKADKIRAQVNEDFREVEDAVVTAATEAASAPTETVPTEADPANTTEKKEEEVKTNEAAE